MAENKTEAEVTAQKNPGSGAITDPAQAANPPANAPTPQTEAEANPDKSGFSAAERLQANDRMPVDFDFEVTNNPDPRAGAEAGDANAQDMGDVEPDAISRMLKIKYRGQEEEIPEEKAITMLQQFKSMDSKYGPIMELARRVQEQTGITDPNQIANAMGEGMLQMLQAQQQGQANATPAESPAVAEANSDPRVMQKNVQSDEQATQAAQEFFEENGLQPTDAAFKSMANIFKYSTAIEQAATILPTLIEDVNMFKQQQQQAAMQSQQTLVDAQAAATAQELGIDDEQTFNDFVSFVEMQEQMFPGYKSAIAMNPTAMDKSIRDYHAIASGNRSATEQAQMKQQVEKDIARAGGETVASRGSDEPGQAAPNRSFNDQMLDLLQQCENANGLIGSVYEIENVEQLTNHLL